VSILVGLDVGTGGARAVAVDESGEVVAEASSEYPLHTPRPGWTEPTGGRARKRCSAKSPRSGRLGASG
jgi:ribulose kinase